jgi:L-rhamnonate dehydratase
LKITNAETIYVRPKEIRERTDSSQDALIVKVTTDEGIIGYGEVDSLPLLTKATFDSPYSHTLSSGLREIIVGEDPFEYEKIWHKMYQSTLYVGREGAVIHAMAGIDIALWDIIGKALNKPVYKLLGGGFKDKIRAYASAMFAFTPEETAERAKSFVERGFTAVKFGWEPMGPDPKLDEALVRSIREAVGDDVDVMIDAGLAWDFKTAMDRIKRFEPYNIFWLEEPLRPNDLRGYKKLANSTSIRIAAGEEESTRAGFQCLMDEGDIDVAQVDLTRVGITQAKKIAYDAYERNIPCINHSFTTDINVAASLHLLASIPNSIFLEYCVEESIVRNSVVANPIKLKDGFAFVPQGPGLGVEIDEDFLEEYRYDL